MIKDLHASSSATLQPGYHRSVDAGRLCPLIPISDVAHVHVCLSLIHASECYVYLQVEYVRGLHGRVEEG